MPNRTYTAGSSYRFGFNGQEKDDELLGPGNVNTTEFWEYDCRLGRRWNMDPIYLAFQSEYSCFNNNPLAFSDPFGLSGSDWFQRTNDNGSKTTVWRPIYKSKGDKENIDGQEYTDVGDTYDDVSTQNGQTLTQHFYQNICLATETNEELDVSSPIRTNMWNINSVYYDQQGYHFQYQYTNSDGEFTESYSKSNASNDWQKTGDTYNDFIESRGVTKAFYNFCDLGDKVTGYGLGGSLVLGAYPGLLAVQGASQGLGSGVANLSAQLSMNGGDLKKVNVTSVLASAFLANPFLGNAVGSGASFSLKDKFSNNLFSGKSKSTFILELSLGTGFSAMGTMSASSLESDGEMQTVISNFIPNYYLSVMNNAVTGNIKK